jgi:chromosome segregation ATPase
MYDAEVKLKDLKEKIASLQESLDQKDNEVDDLKRRLDDADRKYEDIIGEERDEANIHLKDFREQVAALQDTLDEKETQVIKMQGQITEAETENKILLEELEQLMLEKSEAEAEAKAATSGDGNANDKIRIKELEKDLEDASNVAKLQLDELDEQVDGLRDKLSAERMDAAANLKARDATIDELTIKLRKYEAVPSSTMSSFTFHPSIHTAKYSTTKHSTNDPSCADSVVSDKTGTGSFAAGSFASPSFGMGEIAPETPEINTDDVTDIEGAKQKVYEARADATSVRESLEISTKRCAELTLDNERLTKRNSELVDTTRERDELKDKVRDWTAEAYRWKRRAEDAESKLAKLSNPETSDAESDPIAAQENMIKAAMNNNSGRAAPKKEEKSGGWSFFGMSAASNPNSAHDSATFRSDGSEGDSSSAGKDAQIENLNETIAKLRSEMFQLKTSHKEEKYLTEKRIAQLEGENEALTLQNGTLEQLSRFHEDQ